MYDFKCACGHEDAEFMQMAAAVPVGDCIECPACHAGTYQRLISVPSGAMEKEYHTPIEMYSVAMDNDWEIAEFRRKTSGTVEVNDDPAHPMYGIPVAANRRQKMRALDASGHIERN